MGSSFLIVSVCSACFCGTISVTLLLKYLGSVSVTIVEESPKTIAPLFGPLVELPQLNCNNKSEQEKTEYNTDFIIIKN
jgi:hypothetical protein